MNKYKIVSGKLPSSSFPGLIIQIGATEPSAYEFVHWMQKSNKGNDDESDCLKSFAYSYKLSGAIA